MRRAPYANASAPVTPVVSSKVFDALYDTAPVPIQLKKIYAVPAELSKVGQFGSQVQQHDESYGWSDNYVAHPVNVAYRDIIAKLSAEAEEKPVENQHYTYQQIVDARFRDLRNMKDDENTYKLIEKLRYAGASDSEIEEVLKKKRTQKLQDYVDFNLTPDQAASHALSSGYTPSPSGRLIRTATTTAGAHINHRFPTQVTMGLGTPTTPGAPAAITAAARPTGLASMFPTTVSPGGTRTLDRNALAARLGHSPFPTTPVRPRGSGGRATSK